MLMPGTGMSGALDPAIGGVDDSQTDRELLRRCENDVCIGQVAEISAVKAWI